MWPSRLLENEISQLGTCVLRRLRPFNRSHSTLAIQAVCPPPSLLCFGTEEENGGLQRPTLWGTDKSVVLFPGCVFHAECKAKSFGAPAKVSRNASSVFSPSLLFMPGAEVWCHGDNGLAVTGGIFLSSLLLLLSRWPWKLGKPTRPIRTIFIRIVPWPLGHFNKMLSILALGKLPDLLWKWNEVNTQ